MARKPASQAEKSAALPNVPEFTKDEELKAYRDMLLIRRFEEKAGQMYGMGLIGGFCHLYIGQEAVVTGITMASKKGDAQITGYRDHGHMLVMGLDPKGVMAELTGRQGGLSRGKGGSMHMFSNEHRFYGGNGIVGAQVSLGTGLAFAAKYRGEKSFTIAKLWNLPVLYIVENNRYAMGTSVERATAQHDFSKRGLSFNIPGEQVDGMDVRLVHDAARRAIDRIRDGGGPYILEMMTYRYRGHSMSDPAKYRSKDEVTTMRAERDPIEQVKTRILEKRYGTEELLKQIETEVRAIVTEAADFATADPEPDASELWTDIYA